MNDETILRSRREAGKTYRMVRRGNADWRHERGSECEAARFGHDCWHTRELNMLDETEPNFYADLLAAQAEMPALQKSGINPHFRNKFVPLEELIQAILPILNRHRFILTQAPTIIDGQPALTTQIIHVTGERLGDTMLLLCAKDDPQAQGSAITYARRYSLMGLLGLTADADDDSSPQRQNGHSERPAAPRPAHAITPREASKLAVAGRAAREPMGPCPECHAPAGRPHATGCPIGMAEKGV